MLRSSNCVLTGKSPAELASLNECPIDPGTETASLVYPSSHPYLPFILLHVHSSIHPLVCMSFCPFIHTFHKFTHFFCLHLFIHLFILTFHSSIHPPIHLHHILSIIPKLLYQPIHLSIYLLYVSIYRYHSIILSFISYCSFPPYLCLPPVFPSFFLSFHFSLCHPSLL